VDVSLNNTPTTLTQRQVTKHAKVSFDSGNTFKIKPYKRNTLALGHFFFNETLISYTFKRVDVGIRKSQWELI